MTRRVYKYLVATLVLLGAGGLASVLAVQEGVAAPGGQRQATAQASATNPVRFTNNLVGYLKRTGFQVNPGYPMLSTNDACAKYSYPALHSCWGNNPVAPYVIPVVKAWPDEHVGPTPANVFGRVRPGYIPTYRFDPRDAIVLYGKMPPPGKYMSVQTWVWSQAGHWKAKDYRAWANAASRPYPMQYMFSTIPASDPKAERTFSFASLGDVVNNVVMRRKSGDPFGRNRYFILTPSATTDRAVRRALQAQGVPNRYIFTTEIPSRGKFGPIGPLGMGKNALDFNTLFRYAFPDDPQAAQQWWANPPLTVLRVRAPASVGPVRRYGLLTYGRRTAHSERYLAGDLQALVNAVCARTSSNLNRASADCTQPPPASSIMVEYGDFAWNGPHCLKLHAWCGDQNEAAVFSSPPVALDAGQVYAMVGTLATETGNATYVGLSVNDAATFLAPTGVTDAALKGSADGYANTVHNTGRFFVHYFTRDCDTPALKNLLGGRLPYDCTTITPQMVPPKGDTGAPGHAALKGMFFPVLRDYIAPGTEHGPNVAELLRTRVLSFTTP